MFNSQLDAILTVVISRWSVGEVYDGTLHSSIVLEVRNQNEL